MGDQDPVPSQDPREGRARQPDGRLEKLCAPAQCQALLVRLVVALCPCVVVTPPTLLACQLKQPVSETQYQALLAGAQQVHRVVGSSRLGCLIGRLPHQERKAAQVVRIQCQVNGVIPVTRQFELRHGVLR